MDSKKYEHFIWSVVLVPLLVPYSCYIGVVFVVSCYNFLKIACIAASFLCP